MSWPIAQSVSSSDVTACGVSAIIVPMPCAPCWSFTMHGRAADERERVLDRVGRARADRDRDVDVALREELHRAELVARAGDGERRVEDGHAHQVELTHHGEAVVRDRRADARQHEVGVREPACRPRYSDGRPREMTMRKSSGSATETSWPRARAARTRRLVE